MTRVGKVDAAIQALSTGGANVRCSDMKSILQSLGFRIINGSRGKHRIYHHDGLDGFKGGNYDCGHGQDAQLLKKYVKNVLAVVLEYEDELRLNLGEEL